MDPASVAEPILAYFRCLEDGDYTEIAALFTEDATAWMGPSGDVHLDGADAIASYAHKAAELSSQMFLTRGPQVEVDGDMASAHTKVVAYTVPRPPELLIMARVQYLDRLRCVGGRWRIERREHKELWRATLPVAGVRWRDASA